MVNIKPKGNRWRVEIYFRWPDGARYRKRLLAPVAAKSAALRWGQQYEAQVLAKGREALEAERAPMQTLEAAPPPVPTLAEFFDRYLAHCEGDGESVEFTDQTQCL